MNDTTTDRALQGDAVPLPKVALEPFAIGPCCTISDAIAYGDSRAEHARREALIGVVEALEAGHDALVAAATDYHAAMAGYRPHIHKAMDMEVASVKAVLERVRATKGPTPPGAAQGDGS